MTRRIVSALLLIVCASTFTFAQPQRTPMQHKEMRPFREAIISKLNLTDAQETQMHKLRIELMKKQTQLRAKIQTLRLDSKELFLADKIDRKAIESNIKAVTDLQEQLKLNMLDFWFGVNSILTPEQQKVWKKAPMELQEHMKGRARGMMHERFQDDSDSR